MSAVPRSVSSGRLAMYGDHRLKIGMFGPNCSSGLAATKVPERWSGSWDDNVRLARMVDEAGIDFILPVARWKGYPGPTNFEAHTFETITWATGLLAATKRITIFGTVHAPLVHPVFAAKQFVTADHVGCGRFGLNLVAGWNQDEFDMFGATQREHDIRYEYAGEWLDVVTQIWTRPEPFDFDGAFIHLKRVEAEPKPYGGTRPIVMNAGSSAAGKSFAIARADHLFTALRTLESGSADVQAIRDRVHALGRDSGIFTSINVDCRPTQREAEAYYRWYDDELADWEAVDHMHVVGRNNASTAHQSDTYQRLRIRFAAGYGGYPCVGDPDHVAAELARVSEAGFLGFAAGFVNYLDEFPYFRDEVLPRLERLGLREPQQSS
jgi:dimethylsulfone monooxygenase